MKIRPDRTGVLESEPPSADLIQGLCTDSVARSERNQITCLSTGLEANSAICVRVSAARAVSASFSRVLWERRSRAEGGPLEQRVEVIARVPGPKPFDRSRRRHATALILVEHEHVSRVWGRTSPRYSHGSLHIAASFQRCRWFATAFAMRIRRCHPKLIGWDARCSVERKPIGSCRVRRGLMPLRWNTLIRRERGFNRSESGQRGLRGNRRPEPPRRWDVRCLAELRGPLRSCEIDCRPARLLTSPQRS